LVKQILKLHDSDELSDTQEFFDIGMDSLMAVQCRNRLQKAVGNQYPIPNSIFFDKQNIKDLSAYLIGLLAKFFPAAADSIDNSKEANPWIIKLYQDAPEIHLVCLHYAGGGAYNCFADWRKFLPSHIGLDLIQLPGRENRASESFATDVNLVAQTIAAELVLYSKPIILFGHSMGAMLALLVAHYLDTLYNQPPIYFFCSSFDLKSTVQISVEATGKQFSDDEFIEKIIAKFDAIPMIVRYDPTLMKQFLPIIRADFTLMESYDFNLKFDIPCKISYMFGKDDPSIVAQDSFTSLGDVKFFDGGHLYINKNKQEVIDWIFNQINTILIK
jgi:surfactin synthase thioesterase subunit/acyl carrier protein